MDGQTNGQQGGRMVDSINPMLMQMLIAKAQQGQGQMRQGAGGAIPQAPMQRSPLPQTPAAGGQPQGLLGGGGMGGMSPQMLAMLMQKLKGAQPPAGPGQSVPENYQRIGQQFSGALPQPNFGSQYQMPPDFNWMPGSGGL